MSSIPTTHRRSGTVRSTSTASTASSGDEFRLSASQSPPSKLRVLRRSRRKADGDVDRMGVDHAGSDTGDDAGNDAGNDAGSNASQRVNRGGGGNGNGIGHPHRVERFVLLKLGFQLLRADPTDDLYVSPPHLTCNNCKIRKKPCITDPLYIIKGRPGHVGRVRCHGCISQSCNEGTKTTRDWEYRITCVDGKTNADWTDSEDDDMNNAVHQQRSLQSADAIMRMQQVKPRFTLKRIPKLGGRLAKSREEVAKRARNGGVSRRRDGFKAPDHLP